MTRLPPLPTIQEIIKIYGLTARKKLSQNFLLDLNLTRKIVKKAGKLKDGFVIEVGPGPGGITRCIINEDPKKVLVIEKDRRFMPSLQILGEASNNKVQAIQGDIMDFNLNPFIPEEYKVPWEDSSPNVHLIGNLPFSVSTPLIIKWLKSISLRNNAWSFGRVPLTLTFQKEVAERMIAPPRSEYRCRLSIMCQHLCDVNHVFTIPGRAFVPPPDVDVAVVRFVPKVKPLISQPFELVEKFCRNLFNQSNKMCKKPIATLFPPQREDLVCEIFELSRVSEHKRSFQLSMTDIKHLCDAYATLIDREPELYYYDFRNKAEARMSKKNLIITDLEQRLLGNS